MRLALLSDVHADWPMLEAALRAVDELGCDRVVCAGDLVDFGMFPEETIALLLERGVACIRGNHDRWAIGRGSAEDPDGDGAAGSAPHDASGWDLSASALRFLAELPTSWHATLEGVRVAVHHASPGSDMRGVAPGSATAAATAGWLDAAGADVLVVGHTHLAFELRHGERRVVNPGSLLSEVPGDFEPLPDASGRPLPFSTGTFGVLELPSRSFRVHRARDGRVVEHYVRAVSP